MSASTPPAHRVLETLRRHPIMALLYAACTVVGLGLGVAFLPEEWSALRRGAAGAFGGAGCAWMMTVTRMLR